MLKGMLWLGAGIVVALSVGFYLVQRKSRAEVEYVVLKREEAVPSTEVPGSLYIRADLEALAGSR